MAEQPFGKSCRAAFLLVNKQEIQANGQHNFREGSEEVEERG
jgi:hypothetical protein